MNGLSVNIIESVFLLFFNISSPFLKKGDIRLHTYRDKMRHTGNRHHTIDSLFNTAFKRKTQRWHPFDIPPGHCRVDSRPTHLVRQWRRCLVIALRTTDARNRILRLGVAVATHALGGRCDLLLLVAAPGAPWSGHFPCRRWCTRARETAQRQPNTRRRISLQTHLDVQWQWLCCYQPATVHDPRGQNDDLGVELAPKLTRAKRPGQKRNFVEK